MKKFILSVIIVSLSIVGCTTVEPEKASTLNSHSMFVEIEDGDTYIIVYHKQTKVMYAISDGSYNHGTFTVMLDTDGKPMLYNGD